MFFSSTMSASLLLLALMTLPLVTAFFIPTYSCGSRISHSLAKSWCPSSQCTVFRNAGEIPNSNSVRIRVSYRKTRAPPPIKMAMAESCVPILEQAFEAALISSLPEADESQLEELLAILTTTARSLERRLKQGQMDESTARDRLTSSMRQKLLDEEALVTNQQWDEIMTTFSALHRPASSQPFDVQSSLSGLEKLLQDGIESVALQPGSVGGSVAVELKALVTTVCRSFSRRLAQGRIASPGDRAALWAAVEEQLRSRVVDEEGLLPASDWAGLFRRLTAPGPAPPASSQPSLRPPAPAVAAAPAAAAEETAARKAGVLAELRQLFPTHEDAVLADAAARGPDLEAAVFEVLSAERPRTGLPGPPPAQAVAAEAALPAAGGEERSLTTPPVTTGACSFGLCFDVVARGRPIRITGLRTASSPGLNWGQGQAIRVAVFATAAPRSARGAELDAGLWRRVGGGAGVTLPMVSWADRDPAYGDVPLDGPVDIPAGATRGFLVHTNDLYGLVTGVGRGAGGTDEVLGPDAEEVEPLRPGTPVCGDEWVEVRAGYTIGAAVFEEFDGVAVPAAGAFVGTLLYTLL